MIARVRLHEFREPYTRKLRRTWIGERFDTGAKDWVFLCAEDTSLKAKEYIRQYCEFRHWEVPQIIEVVR